MEAVSAAVMTMIVTDAAEGSFALRWRGTLQSAGCSRTCGPLREGLFWFAVVIAVGAVAAVVLYYVTSGVWLLVHAWPH